MSELELLKEHLRRVTATSPIGDLVMSHVEAIIKEVRKEERTPKNVNLVCDNKAVL